MSVRRFFPCLFLRLVYGLLLTVLLPVPVYATDFKISGSFTTTMQHVNRHFLREEDPVRQPDFSVWQRLRTRVDMITSPALRATTVFDIDTIWGSNSNRWSRTPAYGGSLGTDGYNVKVFLAYVDWLVPETDLRLRMGKQTFILPFATAGSAILGDRGYGISFAWPFNDNVALSGFWLRARNDDYIKGKPGTATEWVSSSDESGLHDSADYFALVLNLKDKGYTISPWVVFGTAGRNSAEAARDAVVPAVWEKRKDVGDHQRMWYGGVATELNLWSPLTVGVDLSYGTMRGVDKVMNRQGWVVSSSVAYKLDWGTPKITAWYGSGDDGDLSNGSERLGAIAPAWTATSFGFRDYGKFSTNHGFNVNNISSNPAGSLGVVLELDSFSFVNNIEHVVRFGYMRGTNDEKMAKHVRSVDPVPGRYSRPPMRPDYALGYPFNPCLYLTTKDSLFEFNLDTLYTINNNLKFIFEAGVIRLNLDEDLWAIKHGYDKINHRIAASMVYTF